MAARTVDLFVPLAEAERPPAELAARALGESAAALHYFDLILALVPDSPGDRLSRVRLRLQRGERAAAREDLKWLLENNPPGVDLDRVSELYQSLGPGDSQEP